MDFEDLTISLLDEAPLCYTEQGAWEWAEQEAQSREEAMIDYWMERTEYE